MNDTAPLPLLDRPEHVPFHRIDAAGVEPAVDALLAEARAALDAIASQAGPRTTENTLRALDLATSRLDERAAILSHLESVRTSTEWRAAYNRVQPRIGAFFASIPLDGRLFEALQAFARTEEAGTLLGPWRRFLDKTLDEFRRNGAALGATEKTRLEALAVALTEVTTAFSQNVLDSTGSYEWHVTDAHGVAGLPESARAAARESAASRGLEGWRFTLQAPSYLAVMTHADDGVLREAMWRAYNNRATEEGRDNRPLVAKILALRAEKAGLLGFKDYADLVLADRMAGSGLRAQTFVDDLEARTRPAFERETAELAAFRASVQGDWDGVMRPWDVAYWAEKQRRARFDLDEEDLRPYFEAGRVMDGMFSLVSRLYGIAFRARPDVPVWHADVKVFDVTEDDRTLGRFYVDLHPRDGKRDGAWMAHLRTASTPDEPQIGLFCANLTPPSATRPALLTHHEVETLFHEFGHLLHHCLSRVPVRSLAGTNVAWDFVELPSQIMENWCWSRAALDLFARHHETGAPIPEDLFQRMQAARTFRAASAQMRQLGFASVDLALHRTYEPGRDGDVIAFAHRWMSRFTPTELPLPYGMIASFGHLFASPVGYAAGYYSYKWAEVLDADAFSRFEREGVLSASVGRAFRDTILAQGDGDAPEALFRAFMGRDPDPSALLRRNGLAA